MSKLRIHIKSESYYTGMLLAKYKSMFHEMLTYLSKCYKFNLPDRCTFCDIDSDVVEAWFKQYITLDEEKEDALLFVIGKGKADKGCLGNWVVGIDTSIMIYLAYEYDYIVKITALIGLVIVTGDWKNKELLCNMENSSRKILSNYKLDYNYNRRNISFQWINFLPTEYMWGYNGLRKMRNSKICTYSIDDLFSSHSNLLQHWELGDANGKFQYQYDAYYGYWQDYYDDLET
ncbi:MAG: hypothetical protein HZC48_07740 [Nitrospirae bacterium]|nr:hypothetical protein [Nitrospirota bacterium]